MERQNISIKTVNGDILFGFAWEVEKPEGVVVIATGMEETSYRYDGWMEVNAQRISEKWRSIL